MSVTTWMKDHTKREFLKKYIDIPKVDVFPDQVVYSTSTDLARMGSAVDYGIRMWLSAKFGAKHHNPWVSELALRSKDISKDQRAVIKKFIGECQVYFTNTKMVDEEFAVKVWGLASLDTIWRVGVIPANLPDWPTKEEISEIKQLMKGVIEHYPRPESYCLLNPTFDFASELTGGADADVVQDDTIVEIKTIKIKRKPYLLDHILQLVMYAALSRIGGVTGNERASIDKIGIYFARHFKYLEWNLYDVVTEDGLQKICDFIQENSDDSSSGMRIGSLLEEEYFLSPHDPIGSWGSGMPEDSDDTYNIFG